MLVSFRQNNKVIALLCGQKSHIVLTVQSAIKINRFQCWSCFGKIPRLLSYFLATNRSFSYNVSICNLNQSISMLISFRQNTKVIALLFGQKSLIFITFQSAIKIDQFQCWSVVGKIPRLQPYFLAKNRSFSSLFNLESKSINFNFGHFSVNNQGYSLTLWPKIAHFHHFSICNQSQSISNLVIFGKLPRLQPYFFAKNRTFSSLLNMQSKSINFNVGHPLENTKVIALLFGQRSLIVL